MTMTFETLLYAIDAHVLTITLNRPDKLNAVSDLMVTELIAAFDAADADDDVRAIVVTGAGRVFCAGADLESGSDAFERSAEDGSVPRDLGGTVAMRIFASRKPVIGAINGAAVGFGATLTLPMDVRLAAEGVRFGFVFTRRGIVPEAASSWFLPRITGIGPALEWTLTGRMVGAEEARAAGLVRSVHAPGELLATALTIAREIADHAAPVSVALTRALMWRGLGLADPMDAHRIDSRVMRARGQSADVHEGVTAFLEKRAPVWPGRVSSDLPDVYPWWPEPQY